MYRPVDRKHIKSAVLVFFLCGVPGVVLGWIGLQFFNQWATISSAIVFTAGFLLFVVCIVYPFKWNVAWFSYLLERLGRVGWLRKLHISQHGEGAITLALLLIGLETYYQMIVGAGSYVRNDVAGKAFMFFALSWIYISMYLHYKNLNALSDLAQIIDYDSKPHFRQKVKNTIRSIDKLSLVLLVAGIVISATVTYWVDAQDNIPSRCTFYVQTPWNKSAAFPISYPPTSLTYVTYKLTGGLIYGFLAVIGGLTVVTTTMLLWLTSDDVKATINVYDPNCLKPAERLLNTFWLLTGSGLLLVPFLTLASVSLQESGQAAAARWSNYVNWTYIIFFVGFFFFSLVKLFEFVSTAKSRADQKIRAEFEYALKRKVNRKKLIEAETKLKLLQTFKSRPTLSTVLQIVEIVAMVIVSNLLRSWI